MVTGALNGIHHRMPGLHFAFDRERDLYASFMPEDRSIEDIAEAIQAEWAKVPRPPLTLVL